MRVKFQIVLVKDTPSNISSVLQWTNPIAFGCLVLFPFLYTEDQYDGEGKHFRYRRKLKGNLIKLY